MKTPIFITLLVLGCTMAMAQQIIGYEYWFDGNFAARTSVAHSPTTTLNLTTNVVATNLATGLHTITLRVVDDSARYSAPTPAYLFYSKTADNTITAYRFWFDDNLAGATTNTISASTSATIPIDIPCLSLTNGIHQFSMQVKSFDGSWSAPVQSLFYKRGGLVGAQTFQLTELRYWFDGNINSAVSQNLTASTQISTTFMANAASLNDGNHLISWQVKDHTGTWSQPVSASFFKRGNATNPTIELTAYRYWFNQIGPPTAEIALANPAINANVNQSIGTTSLTKGWHTVFVQLKDRAGIWSTAITDSFYRNAIPVAGFAVQNPTVCVGIDSVTLINQAQEADSVFWTFGDGSTSSLWQPSHQYLQTGQFAISQTAVDKASGFSSQLSMPNSADVRGLPVSAFAFAVNNRDVQFTNQSAWAANYLWRFGDGDSSTLENPLHSYATSGSFQAELEVEGYCGTATSLQTVLLVFGLKEDILHALQVYPNPASEKLQIKLVLRNPAPVVMRITNAAGQTVWVYKSTGTTMSENEQLNIAHWPPGLYLLHLTLPEEQRTFKIIVN
jgi:PKD repeat protein